MINVIIVDDESPARSVLNDMLSQFFPGRFNVLDMCASVDEAVITILSKKPELVFLDIQMPEKNGFELLKMLPNRDFAVVFTTAYGDYALKAIKYSALDYLLKPIDLDALEALVIKIEKSLLTRLNSRVIEGLLQNIQKEQSRVLVIPTEKSIELVKLDEIEFFKASGSYTELQLVEGETIIASKSIGHFESLLEEDDFLRTHKSYLVNQFGIVRFLKKECELVLKSGLTVPVSFRKKANVLSSLHELHK